MRLGWIQRSLDGRSRGHGSCRRGYWGEMAEGSGPGFWNGRTAETQLLQFCGTKKGFGVQENDLGPALEVKADQEILHGTH